MLPSEMVNAHCSLDPGKDRRAFSVSFLMTEEGEVMDHHISRTLIHSCAKLSYRQAQVPHSFSHVHSFVHMYSLTHMRAEVVRSCHTGNLGTSHFEGPTRLCY